MEQIDLLPEVEEEGRGKLIADYLGLKKNKQGFYPTQIGTKTDIGIFRTMKRLILDGE